MKVVILAGGFGTRLSEETHSRPKPMVEIGGQPIMCHIMRHYAHHGHNEFAIALGYMGDYIKRYFMVYPKLAAPAMCVDLASGEVEVKGRPKDDWKLHLVNTGLHTMTGGRIRRLGLGGYLDETFMATYGDGVSNVDVTALLEFHRAHGKLATVTAVRPPARFGGLAIEGDAVRAFTEKPLAGEGWINGGFFVFEPQVLEYLEDDTTVLERAPLERLAAEGQLMAYRHDDFWQCMDTLRDLRYLNGLWSDGKAPWATWLMG